MKKFKAVCILFVLLAVLTGSVFAAGANQEGQRVTRVNVTQTSSDQSPWHHGTVAFANYLNQNSGGRFDAHVFPSASLSQGNYTIMMEQMQSGALQVAVESLTVLGAYNEKAGILNMPFTFADVNHVLRFLELNDPTWAGWMKEFEKSNFVILAGSPRPMRQLNNNVRMIKKVEDMEGIVFRVPVNPMYVAIFETLGAKPVPAPSSDIHTGIRLGIFNGEDNSIQAQYDFRTFELAKNFSIVNYIADLSFIFMNRDFYYNASAADRRMFHDAAREFVRVEMQENESYLQVAMDAGRWLNVDFYIMPEEDKQAFKDKLAPFYAEYEEHYTPEEWKAFHDAVRRTAP
jgi:TRAP-type C4-dicarboxylate transport system substrate-binding protein